MESVPSVNQVVEPADRFSPTKSIYEAKAGEIFFKNFLAGMGRALGGIFIYLVFIGISVYFFINTALPQIQPFIDEYRQAVQGINSLNKTTKPSAGSDLKQYQQFIQDLQPTIAK
jgi:hypothetical protein